MWRRRRARHKNLAALAATSRWSARWPVRQRPLWASEPTRVLPPVPAEPVRPVPVELVRPYVYHPAGWR